MMPILYRRNLMCKLLIVKYLKQKKPHNELVVRLFTKKQGFLTPSFVFFHLYDVVNYLW